MQHEVEPKTQKDGAWLLPIAVILSLLWIAAFLLFLEAAAECAEATAASGYIERHFGCLPPNAVGDFFAGAAAPLAFIWLVTAVLIQARELKAQRLELQLTRKEYELSRAELEETREVMKAQAEEARRSANFVEEQTKILAAERREREQAAAGAVFDAKLEEFWERAKRALREVYYQTEIPVAEGRRQTQNNHLHFTGINGALEGMLSASDALEGAMPMMTSDFLSSGGPKALIAALSEELQTILAGQALIDTPRQLEVKRHRLETFVSLLQELQRRLAVETGPGSTLQAK